MIATITHPLVGYETETVVWTRLLGQGFFQPTIASAYGLGRGWGGDLAVPARRRRRHGARGARHAAPAAVRPQRSARGCWRSLAWALFAALAPTLLGIDHQGLLSIVKAGDHTALNLTLHDGSRYPLRTLVPIAAVAGLLALAAARLLGADPGPPPARPAQGAQRSTPALSG